MSGLESHEHVGPGVPTRPSVPSIEEVQTRLLKWLGEGGGGLERYCAERVRDEALLLDSARLLQQVLARVALSIHMLPDGEMTSDWLDARTDEAIADILRQDDERLRTGQCDAILGSEIAGLLVDWLGLNEEKAHERTVAYNALPGRVRRAFWAIAIKNIEITDLVGTEWDTVEEVREDTLTALEVLLDKKRDFGRSEEGE